MAEQDEALPVLERLFAPIGDRRHAALVAGDVGVGLVLSGIVQAALAVSRQPAALVDAVAYALLGAVIGLTKSRVAAVLCFLVGLAAAVLTLLGHIEGGLPSPGRYVLLSATALALAGRALQATFGYQRLTMAAGSGPVVDRA